MFFVCVFLECQTGRYGQDCAETCTCEPHSTITCPSVDGRCLCKDGFEGANCESDVNECKTESLNTCDDHSDCKNRHGDYYCECHEGYIPIGDNTCRGKQLLKVITRRSDTFKTIIIIEL